MTRVMMVMAWAVMSPMHVLAQSPTVDSIKGCYELAILSNTDVPEHLGRPWPLPSHIGLSPLPTPVPRISPGASRVVYPSDYPYRPFLSWRVREDGRVWVGRELGTGGIALTVVPAEEGVLEGVIAYSTDAVAHEPSYFEQEVRLTPAPLCYCGMD